MDDGKSSRKRKRFNDMSFDLTGTKFGQLRRVLQELRPFVLEALRCPDFQNNRSAPMVRKGTKQIREICKQLRQETMMLVKQRKTTDPSSAAGAAGGTERAEDSSLLVKQRKAVDPSSAAGGTEKAEESSLKKQVKVEIDSLIFADDPGPSLAGCAPAGWNFILVRSPSGKGIV